ncbi:MULTISPECIES: TRAP transporter small permease [unclassified Halomonas]|uniref:TRAP transporter small permease n=1 Tax=unclassified Halomonas TaxID=2609666 RepID=UPI001CF161A7|nr:MULTISPECIES: TRAP transporter small permease [unclassified Halomonas]MCA8863656.1 TRAP transporter small permease [Halomonas sp. SBBP1]UZH08971.1 TRAP transporter small permease [Halomonas sp. BDJS001]
MHHFDNGLEKEPAPTLFDVIAKVIRIVAGTILVFLTLLVTLEVVSRAVFNVSFHMVEEVTGYLVVALTLLGAGLSLRDGTLFRVAFLFDKLPHPARASLMALFSLLGVGVCGVLIWQTCRLVASSYTRGNVAPTVLMTPLWIPQMLLPFGLAVIAVFLIEQLWRQRRSCGRG